MRERAGPTLRVPVAASSMIAAMHTSSAAFKISTRGKGTYEITRQIAAAVEASEVARHFEEAGTRLPQSTWAALDAWTQAERNDR